MVDTQLLKRADEHLDKVSNICRMLREGRFATATEGFALVEDALFNALMALRILVQGADDA